MEHKCFVFAERFPDQFCATLRLLRRRVRLSRELADDVVRSRGHIERVYRVDNTIHTEVPHIDNFRHGCARTWHSCGIQLFMEELFIDGNLHGVVRGWWSNGNQHWEWSFSRGAPIGCDRWWYEDGTLSLE